jgi:endoglucanase
MAPALATPCLRGFNLAGAEFGQLPGTLNKDYTYPTAETVTYLAGTGASTIRLPFRWERLQPKLGADFAPEELAALDAAVASMTDAGLTVVLDPHNYAYYDGSRIGSEAVPASAFADFWARLARHEAGKPGIVLSLMNEPYDIQAADWLDIANLAIAAIREAGATNLILVPGTAYTGAHSWTKTLVTGNNGKVMGGVEDPLDRFAYDFHQYIDADFSGRTAGWLRAHGRRGFLGEFAASSDPACVAAMQRLVKTVDAAPDAWIGWTYWAAGAWWPSDYIFSAMPQDGVDRPQVTALKPFFVAGDGSKPSCKAPDKDED